MKTDSFGDTLWTQKFAISNDPFSAAYPQSFTISESNKILVGGSYTTIIGGNWFVSKYTLTLSGIEHTPDPILPNFEFFQNYPNPFNPRTNSVCNSQ